MRALSVIATLAVFLAVVAGLSEKQRIIGGTETTIENFPYISALLYSSNLINFWYTCVGAIINNRSIISAAHCFYGDAVNKWRIRVGSTNANSGGIVYYTRSITNHPDYNQFFFDNDIAILRSSSAFVFGNNIGAASIAGSNYNVGDYQNVRAIGWGASSFDGLPSERLRYLHLWNIHIGTCKFIYNELAMSVTDNMLCSGWFDVANRNECLGDSGGPVTHNNVVVGVSSWGQNCVLPRFPAVSTRISRYTPWIQANA